jgi:hypothetical protein
MRVESDKWYNRIVRDARYNDRKSGRHIDPNQKFITTRDLLEMQNKQQNKCYYCQIQMEWLERRKNKKGLTLERANNSLPHYTSNCLGLCCKSCNSKRFCKNLGLMKRYFSKWKELALDVHVKIDGTRRCSLMT